MSLLVRLQTLGLTEAEAAALVALCEHGPLGAQRLSELSRIPRSTLYPTLRSLQDRGLVEHGAGRNRRFGVVPPKEALPLVVERERQRVSELEELVRSTVSDLDSLGNGSPRRKVEIVEVLRDRRSIGDRWVRLHREAAREIQVLVKAPLIYGSGNPSEGEALARGVRCRAIYERAVLDDPAIRPYFKEWIEEGEAARIYPGELPMKLAVFDGVRTLLPLTPSRPDQAFQTVLIRHEGLGSCLGVLFETLWDGSDPV